MTWRVGLLIGLFLVASVAPAGSPTNVPSLIKQLGSDKFAEREAASKALANLGAAALPALSEACKQGDFETRRRAELLYHKIQDRLLAAEIMKPRHVRWRFKDQTLRTALQDLNAASGLSIGCNPLWDNERITLDTGSLPFWQALDAFYRQSGWAEGRELPAARSSRSINGKTIVHPPGPYLAFDALRVWKGKVIEDPVDYQGSFRFRAVPTALHRGEGEFDKKDVWFFLEVRADPHVPLLMLDSVALHSLLDGKQAACKVPPSLTVPQEEQRDPRALARLPGNEEGPFGNSCFVIPIASADKKPASWSEVKGSITARVQAKQPFVELKDLAKDVGKSFRGPYNFSLKLLAAEVHEDGDVQVQVRMDDLQAFHEAAAQSEVVRVRPGFVALRGPADIAADHTQILDAKGRPLVRRSLASKTVPNNPDGIDLTMIFQGPVESLASLRLVVAVPRSVNVEVPFTLRNKPAP